MVLATRGGEEPYKVRAIFDNAGFAIPGEDVKVAGVKVGKIDSLDVTDDFKAVVVLNITDETYFDTLYRSATPFVYVAPGRSAQLTFEYEF